MTSDFDPDGALLFSPDPEMKVSFEDTPTYLFRLHTPKSPGITNINTVDSPAKGDAQKRDLFSLPPSEAADMLNAHLQGTGCLRDCNLMSWSSSLLFVRKFGFYRHTAERHRYTAERHRLSDIRLLILETSNLPKRAFIQDMEAIDALKDYCGRRKWGLNGLAILRSGRYYFGEYLSQGHLDVEGCFPAETTLQQLVDKGLLTALCPEVDDRSIPGEWARAVVNIRIQNFECEASDTETDLRTFKRAVRLAEACVPWNFCFAFIVMLLSLRLRKFEDGGLILSELEGYYRENGIEEVPWIGTEEFGPESAVEKMPEVRQFRDIMLKFAWGRRVSSVGGGDKVADDDVEVDGLNRGIQALTLESEGFSRGR